MDSIYANLTQESRGALQNPHVDQPSYQEQKRKTTISQLIQSSTFSNQQDRTTEMPKPISTETPEPDSFKSSSRCNGTDSDDLPWPVAIYEKTKKYSNYISRGTLISNEHVITTARSLPTSAIREMVVKLGLINIKQLSDTTHITRTVVSVSVHPDYNAFSLSNDIAILRLNEKVEFKAFVRAACLWNGYSEVTRVVGHRGSLVDWRNDGSIVRVQMYVAKPEECQVNTRAVEKTFCARNFWGPLSLGGGFYLLNNGSWRLRGIYSTELKCLGTKPSCKSHFSFIDVAQYMPWINNILSEKLQGPLKIQHADQPIRNPTISSSNQQERTTEMPKPISTLTTKPDSFESSSKCSYTDSGNNLRDSPWSVAIYEKQGNISRGTLISNKHVITTARSLPTSAIKTIVVKLGLINLKQLSDKTHITRTVVSASVHPDYNAFSRGNDIAILRLNETVEFNAFVRAACLWNGYSEVTRVFGHRGSLVDWYNEGGTNRIQMYVVKPAYCKVKTRAIEKSFCVKNFWGTWIPGAGVYLLNNGSWRLRGVYSPDFYCQIKSKNDKYKLQYTKVYCSLYLSFIDLAQYMPWINNILSKGE